MPMTILRPGGAPDQWRQYPALRPERVIVLGTCNPVAAPYGLPPAKIRRPGGAGQDGSSIISDKFSFSDVGRQISGFSRNFLLISAEKLSCDHNRTLGTSVASLNFLFGFL